MLKLWGLVPPEGALELSEFSLLQSVLHGSNDQLGFGRYYYNEYGLFYVDENGNRLQNGKICVQGSWAKVYTTITEDTWTDENGVAYTNEEILALPDTCFLDAVFDSNGRLVVDINNNEGVV